MRRIYLAGPMTGIPEFNYPAFHAEAARLRALGYHVENPAENPDPACKSWAGYMRMALAQLVTCDAIYLLKGWENSKGARIERALATELNIQLQYEVGAVRSTPESEPVAEARVEQVAKNHKRVALELNYCDLPPGVHPLYLRGAV